MDRSRAKSSQKELTQMEIKSALIGGKRKFGELLEEVNLAKPNLSKHLEELCKSGEIVKEKGKEDRRERFYRLISAEGAASRLVDYLNREVEPLAKDEVEKLNRIVTQKMVDLAKNLAESETFQKSFGMDEFEDGSELLYVSWAYESEKFLEEKEELNLDKFRNIFDKMQNGKRARNFVEKTFSDPSLAAGKIEARDLSEEFKKLSEALEELTRTNNAMLYKREVEKRNYIMARLGKMLNSILKKLDLEKKIKEFTLP